MGADIRDLEEHFHALLDLPKGKRAAYLEEVAPDLRPRLERLLVADGEETLARPALDGGEAPDSGVPLGIEPGERIGRYGVLSRLGEGGFGVVYLAKQLEPVERQVALKVIKPGLSSREILARFDAERQALALMDHASIARVFDGGATDGGLPFFVMEWVDGTTLIPYAEKAGLSLEARLRLFLAICDAIQHAHQKGVLHRDLKPSNILVAHDSANGDSGASPLGVPKIIDFGIAKALSGRLTERTLDSARYRVLGTPAYMSPEQARGEIDIDTRTDVYSLGAVLYELLCGQPPFDGRRLAGAGFSEMLRIVNEEDPPSPSVRVDKEKARSLRGELDWIVAKALEKDRERRYASASELGADLERFLAGEAVLAGPVSRLYRWRKFMTRHQLPISLAAMLVAALVAGIVGTGAGLVEASKQRDAARLEASRAQAATDFLVETVALADPEIALDPELSVRSLLDRAAAKVVDGTRGQPAAEARVRSALGRAYESQGEHALAEGHLRRAVEIHDAAPRPILADRELYDTLWTQTHVLFRLELPNAQEVAHRARHLAHGILSDSQPELATHLEAMTAAVRSGMHLPETEPVTRALEAAARSLELAEKTLGDGDSLWMLVADGCMDAGFSLWYTPHEERSGELFRCAVEARRRILPAGHPDIGEATSMWVGVLTRAGEWKQGEELARSALAELREVFPEDNFQVAFAKARLGENLTAQGRFAEAESHLLESHDVLLGASGGPATFFPIDSHSRLIRLYAAWGRSESAAVHRRALAEIGAASTWPVAWQMMRWSLEPEDQDLVAAIDRWVAKVGLIAYSAMPGELTEADIGESLADLESAFAPLPRDSARAVVVARLLVYSTNAIRPGQALRPRLAALTLPILETRAEYLLLDLAEARTLTALGASPERRSELIEAAWRGVEDHRLTASRGDAWFTANVKARIGRAFAEIGEVERGRLLLEDAATTLKIQLGEGNRDYQAVRRILSSL